MAFNVVLSFVAAGVTIAVIDIGLYRGPRSLFRVSFGVLLLSLEAALTGESVAAKLSTMFIRVGLSGCLWHLISIIISIAILMNLERTFRYSTGHIRGKQNSFFWVWQYFWNTDFYGQSGWPH